MPFPTRTILRYAGRGAAGLLLLVVLAVGILAVVGGSRLGRSFEGPAHPVAVSTDSAGIAEGERLATFWGCLGCHERDGGGQILFESPAGDRLIAPNLTRMVREHDPAELERAVRHGIGRTGSSLIGMPSSMYARMSDGDLGKVLGYLRSLPSVTDSLPSRRMGLLARYLVLTDNGVLEAEKVGPDAAHGPSPDSLGPASTRADTLALGRYLALTGCPECHGLDLRGSEGGQSPDLRITAAYTLDQFRGFVEEGTGLDGQEKGLMTIIAQNRIGRLTDAELAALHTYLVTLAE